MKISIAASVLILAVGAGLGWHDREQLAALRTTQKQLAREAATLGISPDAALHPTRSTKRSIRATTAQPDTAGLVERAREMDPLRLLDSLSALDSAGLKAILAAAAANVEPDERFRMMLRDSCTTVLANDHPRAALEIFISSPELFTAGDRGRSLFLTALACLARENPTAALDWLRNHPQHASDEAKGELITAVAEQDGQLAFRLVTDLNFKISNYAVGQILNSSKTLEEKSAAVAGLREYLATIREEKVRDQIAASSISGLAGAIGNESFESATRWIADQNLTPQELGQFAEGLHIFITKGETGRWIAWLHQVLPSGKTDLKIQEVVRQWTENDNQAVSKWLGTISAGHVRNTAVRGYAETVSRYEPETAARWAMTLPPGKDRDQTLKEIYRNWPTQDDSSKAAAEAFKSQYGVK